VFGPRVDERMLDLPPFNTNPAGGALADAPPYTALNGFASQGGIWTQIAPGCSATGEGGLPVRDMDGQCGLWTIGVRAYVDVYTSSGTNLQVVRPGLVGVRGMDGNAAPGAFTPTKSTTIRLLDGELTTTLPQRMMVAYPMVAGDVLDALVGEDVAPVLHTYYGPTYVDWAWYGDWTDANGNGVIDTFMPGTAAGANEFVWLGSCNEFPGTFEPESIARGLCREDPNPHSVPPGRPCGSEPLDPGCAATTMTTWLWPGNHPDGGSVLSNSLPGNQVLSWVMRGFDCSTPPTCDDEAAAVNGPADPLLDDQTRATPDDIVLDFSGSLNDLGRMWYGLQLVDQAYDDGLLTTLFAVWGVNCAPGGSAGFDLTSCTFTDVDVRHGLHPLFDTLLYGSMEWGAGGLKGTASSQWHVVREVAEYYLPPIDLPEV
jgi:hypothetical protein